MPMRMWRVAACLLSLVIVPVTPNSSLDPSDVFPRIPSLSSDAHDNPLLRNSISLFFASPTHEVVHVQPPQHGCNSDRLRAVLEQSVSADNSKRSMWAILARLHDSQFSVRCTEDGTAPVLHRRALFCQLTVGRTTCAVTTGAPHPANSSIMILRTANIFRPRPQKSERLTSSSSPPGRKVDELRTSEHFRSKIRKNERPVQEVDVLSQLLATMGPEPVRKKRSDGQI